MQTEGCTGDALRGQGRGKGQPKLTLNTDKILDEFKEAFSLGDKHGDHMACRNLDAEQCDVLGEEFAAVPPRGRRGRLQRRQREIGVADDTQFRECMRQRIAARRESAALLRQIAELG